MSNRILQAILDGQSQIRRDIQNLNKKIDGVEQRLTIRIDRLGQDIAYLEDDSPTTHKYTKLEKRVKKIEKRLVLA